MQVDFHHLFAQCVGHVCMRMNQGASDSIIEAERCMYLTEYSRQCAESGIVMEWRGEDLCPRDCPNGMQYTECASTCMRTCSNLYSLMSAECDDTCFPGCECGPGTILHQDGCVPMEDCPCEYRGETYAAGDKFYSDCNEW